jgi:hypothetical protein
VLYGLHLGRFSDTVTRWLYFLVSLGGTAMVGTGLVMWTVKRRHKLPDPDRLYLGFRLVERLNIAAIAGLSIAMAAFLWANRLLPLELPQRADTELACFFATWGVALVWGLLCPRRLGWTAVLALAAAAWALLPLLNALTTSAHLGATLPAGDWTWAALDLAFLTAGAVLGVVAWHLHRRSPAPATPAKRAARTHAAAPQTPTPAAHAVPNAASEITAGT